jgi:hypothetical protein
LKPPGFFKDLGLFWVFLDPFIILRALGIARIMPFLPTRVASDVFGRGGSGKGPGRPRTTAGITVAT